MQLRSWPGTLSRNSDCPPINFTPVLELQCFGNGCNSCWRLRIVSFALLSSASPTHCHMVQTRIHICLHGPKGRVVGTPLTQHFVLALIMSKNRRHRRSRHDLVVDTGNEPAIIGTPASVSSHLRTSVLVWWSTLTMHLPSLALQHHPCRHTKAMHQLPPMTI
jgi:hypothetical protein